MLRVQRLNAAPKQPDRHAQGAVLVPDACGIGIDEVQRADLVSRHGHGLHEREVSGLVEGIEGHNFAGEGRDVMPPPVLFGLNQFRQSRLDGLRIPHGALLIDQHFARA